MSRKGIFKLKKTEETVYERENVMKNQGKLLL
jgi:hypothetical protein